MPRRSITQKRPSQSDRAATTPNMKCGRCDGNMWRMRKRSNPGGAGNPRSKISAPKSPLSKVNKTLPSRTARASTSSSSLRGATSETDTTSCPSPRSSSATSSGIFSSIRIFIIFTSDPGVYGRYVFGFQAVACAKQACPDIFFGQLWVAGKNVSLTGACPQQFQDEGHGQPRPFDSRLPGKYLFVGFDAFTPVHSKITDYFLKAYLADANISVCPRQFSTSTAPATTTHARIVPSRGRSRSASSSGDSASPLWLSRYR